MTLGLTPEQQALGDAVEGARDQLEAAGVVVEQEGREPDRGVGEAGERLWARAHPEGVVDVLVERYELVVRGCLFDIDREGGWHWCAAQ